VVISLLLVLTLLSVAELLLSERCWRFGGPCCTWCRKAGSTMSEIDAVCDKTRQTANL